MKHRNIYSIFLKQDIFKISTLVFILLSLISGGSIIYAIEFLDSSFRIDNIYAMYATISEFLLIFVATNLFGKEFYYKTINMIRISKRSHWEILCRKLIVMVILSVFVAVCACIEVIIYGIVFHQDILIWNLVWKLVVAYSVYGIFLFVIATPIVMILKNTQSSFIAVLVILSFSPMIINILKGFNVIKNIIAFIPFSFIRNAFSFANFKWDQIIIVLIWSYLLLIFSHKLLKSRGYV